MAIPIGAKQNYTEIHKTRCFCGCRVNRKNRKFIDIDDEAWRNPLCERN
jgi:hypothetical protein